MSSSDVARFDELLARVTALEARVTALAERLEGKDMHGELYGDELNHTADREARRGPGRPPKTAF